MEKEQERLGVEPKLWIRALVKESLRLHPPVLSIIRECVKPEVSLGGDVICLQGTRVQIDILGTHYSKNLWGEQADKFDLSRWLPSNNMIGGEGEEKPALSTTRHIYLPFGYGKKSCVGQALALSASEACVLATLDRFVLRKSDYALFKLRFTQTPSLRLEEIRLKICSKHPNTLSPST